MTWGLVMLLVLVLALGIDHYFGEPHLKIHPVVWMGQYLKVCGGFTVRCSPVPAFVLGATAWWSGVIMTGALAWYLQVFTLHQLARYASENANGNIGGNIGGNVSVAGCLALSGIILMAWFLKSMLSWRMLHAEVNAVETALQQSLQAGRERLSWLVSRDTRLLSGTEVRESAIESLAENLNDSVVAPIFWFLLFGLPGAAIYRFANTADAMWGYRGMREGVYWEWAGKWAAWADDVLSWLPARLTALMLALAAGGLSLKALSTEARKTPSPNSGWPMAAMALIIGVSLQKPGVYKLNPEGRPPQTTDTQAAKKYASKVVLMLAGGALIAIIFIAIIKLL